MNEFLNVFRFHLLDLDVGLDMFITNLPKGWGGGFSEITYPETLIEIEDVLEGNSLFPRHIIKSVSFGTITLRKGIIPSDSDFWHWVVQAVLGVPSPLKFHKGVRKDLLLLQFLSTNLGTGVERIFVEDNQVVDDNVAIGKAVLLRNCVPKRYTCSDLVATDEMVAITELEIQPESIEEAPILSISIPKVMARLALAFGRWAGLLVQITSLYK